VSRLPPVNIVWPLPALFAWAACWTLLLGLGAAGVVAAIALPLAVALGGVLALPATTRWRRLVTGLGFPASLAASGLGTAWPAWIWLLPLGLLALLYPRRTWRDAPWFPTPAGALAGLALELPLPVGARVLDAGCGLGDGLRELRREYPQAHIEGFEWSWPLRLVCAGRCRFARVRRADLWAADWSGYDLVYLFQRPESLARAIEKARRELRPGAWLASLEFAADATPADAVLRRPGRRPVWLYRAASAAAARGPATHGDPVRLRC
jgi:SAM-dependent methyltransferase